MKDDFNYLLIQPDEDGCPITFLTEQDFAQLLANPGESYGVKVVMHDIPECTDPNYWKEGHALLFRIEDGPIRLKPITTAYAVDE